MSRWMDEAYPDVSKLLIHCKPYLHRGITIHSLGRLVSTNEKALAPRDTRANRPRPFCAKVILPFFSLSVLPKGNRDGLMESLCESHPFVAVASSAAELSWVRPSSAVSTPIDDEYSLGRQVA